MNLVVGATGLVGGEICRLLAERGDPVRAFVRRSSDPARVEWLRSLGATTIVGDLKDSGSLVEACAGVSGVLSTASSVASRSEGDSIESVDRDGQLALVEAAVAARVERFVYLSFPELPADFPLQKAKRAVEKQLRRSGIVYTILRSAHFMEVWLGPAVGFDAVGGSARIYGSGKRKVSWISSRDVARAAVAALGDPALACTTVDIGGPEALSPLEVIRMFEVESGRTFVLEHVPEAALESELQRATDSLSKSFAGLMLATARAEPLAPAPLSGLASVRDYVRAQR